MEEQNYQSCSSVLIEEYLQDHPSYSRLYYNVKSLSCFNQSLMCVMLNYVEDFCNFYGITYDELDGLYSSFIRSYNKDLTRFEKTGEYPSLNICSRDNCNHLEYTAALLLSPIVSAHRYKIMHLVYTTKKFTENILFVGAGPGLELMLLKESAKNKYVVETNPSDFFSYMHPEVIQCGLDDQVLYKKKFERAYAIELLEHVDNPYELISMIESILSEEGEFIATTATDIPQFDHIVNFERNPLSFLYKLTELGFRVTFLEDIPHYYFFSKVKAANTFFVFKKDANCFSFSSNLLEKTIHKNN